jgi:hypothetical protein
MEKIDVQCYVYIKENDQYELRSVSFDKDRYGFYFDGKNAYITTDQGRMYRLPEKPDCLKF